ncbi:HAD family hydrolase [bacterium]|nr:HAD family hydrolase [bacterium]
MDPSLVIFDIDGTLCNTFEVDLECYLAAIQQILPLPIGLTDWQQAESITDAAITDWLWRRNCDRSPTAAELQTLITNYRSNLVAALQARPQSFRITPGAPDLLEHLTGPDWYVAIATGGWRQLAHLKLAAAKIPVELLLASSDDAWDRSEIFQLAWERAGHGRSDAFVRTVLVGDGQWDVRVAAKHGWSFLGVGHAERAQQLRAEGASAIVPDFSNMDQILVLLEQCPKPTR